jgi:hypothetical protein
MSRNENRTRVPGIPKDAFTDPVAQDPEPQQGPSQSLSFVTPTEFVDLPSRGVFYPQDHPLHNVESVEIKFMTAKEEDILTSPSLLKSGKCLDRLLKSVLVDKTIKPESLLSTDRNAILVATRITGYGSNYESSYSCKHCGSRNEHSFDLSEINIINSEDGLLEEYGVEIVSIKPIIHEDEIKITKASDRKAELGLAETATTDLLRQLIVKVAGSDDRSLINQLVENMPALDSRHIRKIYSKIVPKISIENIVTCGACGGESRLEVPFDTDFFWPRL